MNYVFMVKENIFVGQWCYPKDCPEELSIVEYDPSNNNAAAAYRFVYECFNGLIPIGKKIDFRDKDQSNLRLDN